MNRALTKVLTRPRLLELALQRIDSYGLSTLSMRSLGRDADVDAMTLYRFVKGKDDLLDGVVGVIMSEVSQELTVIAPTPEWREVLLGGMRAIRRVAMRHPEGFGLVATRPGRDPRARRFAEEIVEALIVDGFSRERAVLAFRVMISYSVGFAIREATTSGEMIVTTGDADKEFDLGAEAILSGIESLQ